MPRPKAAAAASRCCFDRRCDYDRNFARSMTMSDILNKIVAVKREEVAQALERKSLAAVRADAESRVLTRGFEDAVRAGMAGEIGRAHV